MKALVLGSAGQVGAALTEELILQGHKAITFDIVDSRHQDLRIYDNQLLAEKLDDADFVYFLAFDVGGSTYLENSQNTFQFISNNIRLMENTFCLLEKTGKPFIFASSQMSNMTHSNYGLLKNIGERYSNSISNGRVVHFWNVYGFEQDVNKFHVISDFIKMAKFNKIIKMRTTGTEERDFLYSEDCSKALIKLSDKFAEIDKSEKLHITSFQSTKIIEIAKIIADIYGAEFIPGDREDPVQLGIRNVADKYILKYWQPTIKIEEGITRISKQFDKIFKSEQDLING